jgi:hypothetical protein
MLTTQLHTGTPKITQRRARFRAKSRVDCSVCREATGSLVKLLGHGDDALLDLHNFLQIARQANLPFSFDIH